MHDLLPENLINAVRSSDEDADRWIAEFPNLLDHFVQRWNLELASAPVYDLSCNFVIFATRAGKEDVVLKVGVLNDLNSEIEALRAFGGNT